MCVFSFINDPTPCKLAPPAVPLIVIWGLPGEIIDRDSYYPDVVVCFLCNQGKRRHIQSLNIDWRD